MNVVVVTGTDTGVGKTVVTAAVAALATRQGRSVAVAKPVQTGAAPGEPGDLEEVCRLAGPIPAYEGARLPDPLAPLRAAALAGVPLPSLEAQRDAVLGLAADLVLVEGAGGVTVPLGEGWSLLDLGRSLARTGASVSWLVVVRAGLGTLNHTKLTVDAVRASGGQVRGLVVGEWPAEPEPVHRHNLEDLAATSAVPLLGAVPAGVGRLPAAEFSTRAASWLPGLADR